MKLWEVAEQSRLQNDITNSCPYDDDVLVKINNRSGSQIMKAIKSNLTNRIQLTNKTKNTMDKTELECNHSNLKYSK